MTAPTLSAVPDCSDFIGNSWLHQLFQQLLIAVTLSAVPAASSEKQGSCVYFKIQARLTLSSPLFSPLQEQEIPHNVNFLRERKSFRSLERN
jgi:hypothetical protein